MSEDHHPVGGLVRRLDYPMFVVTASDGTEDSGCLVGFATQCSIHPFRFLACLSVKNHTFHVALGAPALGVHLLGADQGELAELFGEETGDAVDKFDRCAWHRGVGGSPILERCAAWLEGSVVERALLGDHLGVLLQPLDGGDGVADGLFTFSQASGMDPGHPA